jgi:C_GCAxxG_C_C family probable redox protein
LKTKPMAPDEAKTDVLARLADPGPGHINCAQAVLGFALAVRGSDPSTIAVAQHLGGGVAGMGEVCGAVSGAALAEALLGSPRELAPSPDDLAATREFLQKSMRDFAAEFGSLRCRELTGYDLTTPEGHDAFLKSGTNERCQEFVGWMCDRLLPFLAQNKSP